MIQSPVQYTYTHWFYRGHYVTITCTGYIHPLVLVEDTTLQLPVQETYTHWSLWRIPLQSYLYRTHTLTGACRGHHVTVTCTGHIDPLVLVEDTMLQLPAHETYTHWSLQRTPRYSYLYRGGGSSVGRASAVHKYSAKKLSHAHAILTLVRVPGARRDFSPRVNFQSRLSYGVCMYMQRPCAITGVRICAHVKSPKHWQPNHYLNTRNTAYTDRN